MIRTAAQGGKLAQGRLPRSNESVAMARYYAYVLFRTPAVG